MDAKWGRESTLKNDGMPGRVSLGALCLVLSGLTASALIAGPAAVFALPAYDSHTQVSPGAVTILPGGTVNLTATVQPGCSPVNSCPHISGTLTWDDGDAGGSFSITACTFLASDNLSLGTCTTTYSGPGVPGLAAVLATYSGSAAYLSSSGSSSIEVKSPGSSSTTSTSSSSTTSSVGSSGPGFIEVAALTGVVVVVALALAFRLTMRKPKSA